MGGLTVGGVNRSSGSTQHRCQVASRSPRRPQTFLSQVRRLQRITVRAGGRWGEGGGGRSPQDARFKEVGLAARRVRRGLGSVGRAYRAVGAAQRHHQLRLVLVRLLRQLEGLLNGQQPLLGPHGGATPRGPVLPALGCSRTH